ncbi:unnamed protein product [Paramecium sonneborni]|uniref:Uncharacterized protein n=1 Tax=Paramecium sonneborni TaxID=65129 RepID=A0A8S1RPF8_9CILI|nr:unnamed protein product [Paramecium sonneborni]
MRENYDSYIISYSQVLTKENSNTKEDQRQKQRPFVKLIESLVEELQFYYDTMRDDNENQKRRNYGVLESNSIRQNCHRKLQKQALIQNGSERNKIWIREQRHHTCENGQP